MNSLDHSTSKYDVRRDGDRDPTPFQPWDDLVTHLKVYAREEPAVAALVCLGVGFILGWKLKPW